MLIKFPRGFAALAAILALSGCGKAEKQANEKPAKQFVVTSAVDCADNAGLDYEVCYKILLEAVDRHDKSAPKFRSLKACEKSEGAGRCERMDEKLFRPRLTAFQLTLSSPPVAAPLYAPKNSQIGFRTASNAEISVDSETYNFTKSAAHAADLYRNKKGGAGGGGMF